MCTVYNSIRFYTTVNWSFISNVLDRLGFHVTWINWIMECISTVSYSYLINDSVYGNVQPYRGIRQGDPISPYIFILCSEVLSGLCKKAGREGALQGIRVARGSPRVNHLLFADDTMFFCEASKKSCDTLVSILSVYEEASGQKINKDKSSITFSCKAPPDVRTQAKQTLGISKEGGLGKYLGLPEHFGRRKRDLFTSIVDRIRQKAISWSSKRLSRAGKLTMLKSVLSAIPTYSMSCFLLPVSLCKRITSVLTRFWWDDPDGKKKICWVSWDKLTKPKELGGLGLRDIQLFNQALLAKLAWRIITAPQSLLARVLTGKYCHRKSFLETEASQSISHGWRSILHGRDLLVQNLGKSIGNGLSTKLWKDSWITLDDNTKPIGPIRERDLDLTVADLLTTEIKWNKQRVEELLPAFSSQILCLQRSTKGAADSYLWKATNSGNYSTKSGYFAAAAPPIHAPMVNIDDFCWIKDVWALKVSPKMKTFLWSILKNALPLGENLLHRGGISGGDCVRCQVRETAVHCFFTCPFAAQVWNCIPINRAVHIAADMTLPEIVVGFRKAVCLPPSGISLHILPWILWVIWTSRNTLLFEGRSLSPEETATKGLKLAQEWSQSQGKLKSVNTLPSLPRNHLKMASCEPVSSNTITCKTDAAWSKDTMTAGFGWVFEGGTLSTPITGSSSQNSIISPLVAEAIAMRSALCMASNLEIPSIRIFTDNSTLARAISSNHQYKEIIGIVHDIRSISSVFASVSISHFSRSENSIADGLAKAALRAHLSLY